MAVMKPRVYVMSAMLATAASCFWLANIGTADPTQAAPAAADPMPAASAFAFDCAIQSRAKGDVDSFLVVANARNVSTATVALCCRFDFEGAFAARAACKAERPPVFFLLARSSVPETALDCRATVLSPGEVYSDSVSFQLYRPEYARCPGSVEIRGSFWVGRPGDSFTEARPLVQDAVRVSAPEPAAP